MKKPSELLAYIDKFIQGVFGVGDAELLKQYIEKLNPGDIYVEVGVDEGKSARVAHEYAHPDVFKFYIDINNVDPHRVSIGRGKWMQQEGMVGIGKKGFFIHGDGDLIGQFMQRFINPVKHDEPFVDLIFLDPHHDYESIKSATLAWEPLVKSGGVLLFHDTDHEETFQFLVDHYGEDGFENHHGKVGVVKK